MSAESPQRPLSERERAACRLVLAGETHRGAYRRVFRYKGKNAKDLAKRLFARPEVKAALAEARKASEAKMILSINDRLGILAGIAQSPISKPTDKVSAIRVYNETSKDTGPDLTTITVKGDPSAPLVTRKMTAEETVAAMREARRRANEAKP